MAIKLDPLTVEDLEARVARPHVPVGLLGMIVVDDEDDFADEHAVNTAMYRAVLRRLEERAART